MNENRRLFLKGTLAVGALTVAAGAGLLTPKSVLAAWPEAAFKAKSVDDALKSLLGSADHESSDAIKVKAPDIAENGAVVPITVSSTLKDVSNIAILASANPSPLTSAYDLGKGTHAYVSTRIKMGKTGDVIAVVKSGGKVYGAKKQVKVTIGGCGG
jgi:sulfur-oxidizing protein SoxY